VVNTSEGIIKRLFKRKIKKPKGKRQNEFTEIVGVEKEDKKPPVFVVTELPEEEETVHQLF